MVKVSALSPSKQPISRGEPVPVHEQADHDLGVDTALLGVAHLAQRVLVLGLEVQGRHVVQAQRHVPSRDGVLKQTVAIWSRYLPDVARVRVRRIVFSLAGTCPRSVRTRPVSRIEVGSTIRAITRSRKVCP